MSPCYFFVHIELAFVRGSGRVNFTGEIGLDVADFYFSVGSEDHDVDHSVHGFSTAWGVDPSGIECDRLTGLGRDALSWLNGGLDGKGLWRSEEL